MPLSRFVLGSSDRSRGVQTEIERYQIEAQGVDFTVMVALPGDHRVEAAKRIEMDTFVALGDLPDEVEAEFAPHDSGTIFILVQRTESETDDPPLLGMARLIPNSEHLGVKTLTDLALIASNPHDIEQSQRIFCALGASRNDYPARGDVRTLIEARFMDAYGCETLDTVLDLATLAPDMALDRGDRFPVIDALLKGLAVYTARLFWEGRLTHLVQFTAVRFHDLLAKTYGLPVEVMFGLEGLVYDSFANGTDQNMTATPSVLHCSELLGAYQAAADESPLLSTFGPLVAAHRPDHYSV